VVETTRMGHGSYSRRFVAGVQRPFRDMVKFFLFQAITGRNYRTTNFRTQAELGYATLFACHNHNCMRSPCITYAAYFTCACDGRGGPWRRHKR
jgi:hypothetical protein